MRYLFDVDDPFDQNNPSMPNVLLIDADTTGQDNRGGSNVGNDPTDRGPWTLGAQTDAIGVARATFTVSMQPGDNFRAAASLLSDALSETQLGQTKADAIDRQLGNNDGYQCPAVWSPMLTVWRKLTLEVDSMERESEATNVRFQYYFEQDRCVVASVTANSPSAGFTTIQCGPDPDPMRAGFAGTNFFEGGAFWCVNGGPQWMIVRSVLGPASYSLTLWGNPGTGIVGQQCKLRDDDPYFGAGPGQLPLTTVLDDNIRSAYRDAYIEVVEADPSLNLVNLVPWQSHLSPADLESDYLLFRGTSSQWDVTSSDAFWARHVVFCYQTHRNNAGDGDGDENCGISQNCLAVSAPYPLLGLPGLSNLPQVFGYTWRIYPGYRSALSTVYVETVRDQRTDANSPLLWQFVAHEVGHNTVGLSGGVIAGSHTEGGLMTGDPEAAQLQNIPGNRSFTAVSLVRFRNTTRW